jgi:hypothetical protein
MEEYLHQMQMIYNGHAYALTGQTLQGGSEEIPGNFAGYTRAAYKGNGIVFACMEVRKRLVVQRGTVQVPAVAVGPSRRSVREPGSLAARGAVAERHDRGSAGADGAGQFALWQLLRAVTRGGLQRMRPDWVHIILGSNANPDEASLQLDAKPIGYAYYPGGPTKPGVQPVLLDVSEVVHYAPRPDPEARFRGLSWMTADRPGDPGGQRLHRPQAEVPGGWRDAEPDHGARQGSPDREREGVRGGVPVEVREP